MDHELERILTYDLTNPATSRGYVRRRLIFIGMLTGLRKTSLPLLSWYNFTECQDHLGQLSFRYVGSVDGLEDDCKNKTRGIKAEKDVPTHFTIFISELAFGINLYSVIKLHKEECAKIDNSPTFFFLALYISRKTITFLRKDVIGHDMFPKMLAEIYTCEVKGVGFREKPTFQSLRATIISKLQRTGNSESQISQRTRHRPIESIK